MVYQDVVRNPKLTPEAKAIYAYLSSMAGSDDECYPSRELMAKELNMGVHRLDKHLALLIGAGVVIKKRMSVGNLKGRNIFKVTHEMEVRKELDAIFENIENSQNSIFRYDENSHDENNHDDGSHDENRHTNNNSINNNRLNNNSINDNSASVPDSTKKVPDETKKEANELFEKVWALYPSKKGKGQVSDTQKKKLLKIGEEELTRAIERYKEGLSRDEWRKPQNGSTFFNSGYVDYLDENWQAGADSSDTEDDAAAWERARAEMERLASIGPRVDGPF